MTIGILTLTEDEAIDLFYLIDNKMDELSRKRTNVDVAMINRLKKIQISINRSFSLGLRIEKRCNTCGYLMGNECSRCG